MKKIIIFFIGFLTFCSFPFRVVQAMTWGEIRTQIRVRIKDTSTSRQRYTDTQLNSMIESAGRDIATVGRPIINGVTISLVSGTTCYSLIASYPYKIIEFKRVRFANKSLPETTIEELDSKVGDKWELQGGIPQNYYSQDTRGQYVCIYPFPNGITGSTGNMSVYFYQDASSYVSDISDPFGDGNIRFQPYHDLFVWRVCADIFLLEGEGDKANYYQQIYESRLTYLKTNIWGKENYTPAFTSQTR